jgi:hypothetical protein
LNFVAPQLESDWFQTLTLEHQSWFQNVPFKFNQPVPLHIGARPVDLHLQGFEALGATVEVSPDGVVHAVATGPGGRLRGAYIELRFPSVGATHAIIMAAALAEGDTVLENAAAEPEVADLAAMLNAAGARVTGRVGYSYHFSPRYFAVKTHAIDEYVPCNQSDTRECMQP